MPGRGRPPAWAGIVTALSKYAELNHLSPLGQQINSYVADDQASLSALAKTIYERLRRSDQQLAAALDIAAWNYVGMWWTGGLDLYLQQGQEDQIRSRNLIRQDFIDDWNRDAKRKAKGIPVYYASLLAFEAELAEDAARVEPGRFPWVPRVYQVRSGQVYYSAKV